MTSQNQESLRKRYLHSLAGYYRDVMKHLHARSMGYNLDFRTRGAAVSYLDAALLPSALDILQEPECIVVDRHWRPSAGDGADLLPPRAGSSGRRPPSFWDEEEDEGESPSPYDQVLSIYEQMALNPYERETRFGFPIIRGRAKDGASIAAPLFTVECVIDFEPERSQLIIRRSDEGLMLNPLIWERICQPAEREMLERHVWNRVPELPLDSQSLSAFFRGLEGVLADMRVADPWPDEVVGFTDQAIPVGAQSLSVAPQAVLLLVKRGDFYLAKDLEELMVSEDAATDSVLAALFDSPEALLESEDSLFESWDPIESDLVFPFPSNESQRLVAHAAEHHRLLAVQGPPGTGKSQTICNLVCHLVAEGKTVLVSSQKNKALEVVQAKLAGLGIEYLSMTLLRDDSESKRVLADKITGLPAYLQQTTFRHLMDRREEIERQLAEARQEAEEVRGRFSEVRRIEREYGRHFQRFAELRERDWLGPEDSVEAGREGALADQVRRFAAARHRCNRAVPILERWANCLPQLRRPDEVAQILARLRECEALLERLARSRQFPDARRHFDDFCRHLDKSAIDRGLTEVETVRPLLSRLGAARERVLVIPDRGTQVVYLGTLLSELPHEVHAQQRRVVRDMAEAAQVVFENRPFRDRVTANCELLGELRRDLLRLRGFAGSWLRHGRPSYYLLRRRLGKVVPSLSRDLKEGLRDLEKWLEYHEMLARGEELAHQLTGQTQAEAAWKHVRGGDQVAWNLWLRETNSALELAELEREFREAAHDCQLDPLRDPAVLQVRTDEEAQAVLDAVRMALQWSEEQHAVRLLQHDLSLEVLGECWFDVLSAALEGDSDSFGPQLETLKEILNQIKPFAEACETLNQTGEIRGYLEQRVALEVSEQETPTPPSVQFIDDVLAAYRLRGVILELQNRCPYTTDEIAARLKKARLRVLALARDALEVRRQLTLAETTGRRSIHMELEFFRKRLKRSRRSYQSFEALKRDFNYDALLAVFPCWTMGLADVARIFPLRAGLFDVAVVDEASQCHLPAALPTLYRAKTVIVVGDEQQLPNADVDWLPDATNKALMEHHDVRGIPKYDVYDAKSNSLLGLALFAREREVFLNEHFRCYPEIIRFCNDRFYAGRLRVTTDSAQNTLGPVLNLVLVDGADDEKVEGYQKAVNRLEARRVLEDVLAKMDDPKYRDMTFGVLSLYRDQAELLERMFAERLVSRPDLRERHKLIVSTVDGFQGDERDVVFYSFRYGPSSPPGVVTTIQRLHNRINVAFTRARKQVFCYVSVPPGMFPRGIVRDFLSYVQSPSSKDPLAGLRFDSDFERDVHDRLAARGFQVIPQYPACGFRIDLVVTDGSGRRLGVECDGERYHYDELGNQLAEDLQRQEILERSGWTIVRIPSRDYWLRPEHWIDHVSQTLAQLPVHGGAPSAPESALQPTTVSPPSTVSPEPGEAPAGEASRPESVGEALATGAPRSAPARAASRSSGGPATFMEYVRSKGLEVIDDRAAGGELWVVGGKQLFNLLSPRGFVWTPRGSEATGYRSAWRGAVSDSDVSKKPSPVTQREGEGARLGQLALWLLRLEPRSTGELAQQLALSREETRELMQALEAEGQVKRVGRGRGRKWTLN